MRFLNGIWQSKPEKSSVGLCAKNPDKPRLTGTIWNAYSKIIKKTHGQKN